MRFLCASVGQARGVVKLTNAVGHGGMSPVASAAEDRTPAADTPGFTQVDHPRTLTLLIGSLELTEIPKGLESIPLP